MKNAIVIGPKYKRYRLDKHRMVKVKDDGRIDRFGHSALRTEVYRVVRVLSGQGFYGSTDLNSIRRILAFSTRSWNYVPFDSSVVGGRIRFGCVFFNKTDSKKLARWAGVRLEEVQPSA